MIITGGDETSDVVARHGLGAVVAPGDVDGVARALTDWLDARDRREQLDSGFELVRRQFDWARVCEPIARFCQSPHLAPDRAAGLVARELDDPRALRAALAQREQEAHGLRATVAAYERGKFMRFMRWLKRAGR
jgi:hypothetical protein